MTDAAIVARRRLVLRNAIISATALLAVFLGLLWWASGTDEFVSAMTDGLIPWWVWFVAWIILFGIALTEEEKRLAIRRQAGLEQ